MTHRQRLFVILLAIAALLFSGLLIYFSVRLSDNKETLDKLYEKVQQLELQSPQDGSDGRTPTNEELLTLITPLIPPPVPGIDGRDGTNGKDGASGADGKDAQPCTTYTDENNDSYLACPDGTQTLIPQPDQPRQIELCSTPLISLGWKYVGTTACLKVKGL